MNEINSRAKKYTNQSALIFIPLTIAGIIFQQIVPQPSLINALLVMVIYSFFLEIADAFAWRKIATDKPDYLPQFFLAFQAVRMFASIALIVIIYAIVDSESFWTYLAVFAIYYLALLGHHTLFFANNK